MSVLACAASEVLIACVCIPGLVQRTFRRLCCSLLTCLLFYVATLYCSVGLAVAAEKWKPRGRVFFFFILGGDFFLFPWVTLLAAVRVACCILFFAGDADDEAEIERCNLEIPGLGFLFPHTSLFSSWTFCFLRIFFILGTF